MTGALGTGRTFLVYDPTVARQAQFAPLAPRPKRLNGDRPIGLLWNGKPNGDVYLDEIRRLLLADDPSLRFIERAKPLAAVAMAPETLEDLLGCGAVVNALGD